MQGEDKPLLDGSDRPERKETKVAQETFSNPPSLYAEAEILKIKDEFEKKAKQQKEEEIAKTRSKLKHSNIPVQFGKGTGLTTVVGKSIVQNQTLTVSFKDGLTIGTSLTSQSGRTVAKSLILSISPWIVSGIALAIDFAIAYHQWRKHQINGRLLREMLQAAARHGTCLAGATLGALLGTMIFPGIGTIIGGILFGVCTPLAVSAAIILIEKIPNKEWSNAKHYQAAPPLMVYHESLDFFDISRNSIPSRQLIEQKKQLRIMDHHPELNADLPQARRAEKLKLFIQTLQAYEMIKDYLGSKGFWENYYPAPSPPLTPPPQGSRQPRTPPLISQQPSHPSRQPPKQPPKQPPQSGSSGKEEDVKYPIPADQGKEKDVKYPIPADQQESLARASISSNGTNNSTLSQRDRSPSENNPLEGSDTFDDLSELKAPKKPRGSSISSNSISITAANASMDDVLKELYSKRRASSSDEIVIIHKLKEDVASTPCKQE